MSLMLTAFTGFSQTGKGSWLLGGSFDFSSSKQKIFGTETKTSQVEISPAVGYFIVPNLAVGINAGISSITEKYQGATTKR